jgi:endonuclease YncB( thermonuclease family)
MPPDRRRRLPSAWANALLFLLGGAAALGIGFASGGLEWEPLGRPGTAPLQSDAAAPVSLASVEMVDGDTFDFDGERIRVADIDTPEVHGRCPEESRLAAKATARMEALLGEGPFELSAIPGRDEDIYGRKLRVVSRSGRSLGDVLVAEGLAHRWVGHKLPWCGSSRSPFSK